VTAGVVAAIAVLAACAGGGGGASLGVVGVTVSEARVLYTGPAVPAGGFMILTNTGDQADALVSASSPAFGSIELHETMQGSDGMMGMQPVTSIPVPAGGTTELEPGSYHLMLLDPTGEIAVGQAVDITLTFDSGATATVMADVQAP